MSQYDDLTDVQLDALIRDRFTSFDRLVKGVISGNIRSLIVSGAPGVGKSFNIMNELTKAVRRDQIESFDVIGGSASAIGLYTSFWENRKHQVVTLLDDTDNVFYDRDSMNILKHALDSGKERIISWEKASSSLNVRGIPTEYMYNGSAIFLTNENFDERIAKGDKMAEHLKALISRSLYLDLAIHCNRSILLRIKQVIHDSKMLEKKGVPTNTQAEIINWLDVNRDKVRVLSLRTVDQLINLTRMEPKSWSQIAETALLFPR